MRQQQRSHLQHREVQSCELTVGTATGTEGQQEGPAGQGGGSGARNLHQQGEYLLQGNTTALQRCGSGHRRLLHSRALEILPWQELRAPGTAPPGIPMRPQQRFSAEAPRVSTSTAKATGIGATRTGSEQTPSPHSCWWRGGPSSARSTYPTKQQKKPSRKLMSPIS